MIRFIFLIVLILSLDFYVFRTFQNQFSGLSGHFKYPIYTLFWLVPAFLLISTLIILFSAKDQEFRPDKLAFYLVSAMVLFYLPKLFIVFFQGIEDLGKFIAWTLKKLSQQESLVYIKAENISRSIIIGRIGLIIAIIPFFAVLYGIVHGRFNFTVNHVQLQFDQLPKAFHGFKIVHFSDFHAGSLAGQQKNFKKAFDLINKQNADLLVFTGDMVNNRANEAEAWVDMFSALKASKGKYSILGNHDYGDYARWDKPEDKSANLELLKKIHKDMGFRLLLNEGIIITNDSDSIALIGVENWGEKPFPQHGRLDLALQEVAHIPFKVLLSHDPTHWEYQVKSKTDIDLTLSGHTHGMQLAFNFAGFSWSPVSLKYPRWKGLHNENGQYLYINIGLGYIGFPGRVGTDPEITVIELNSRKN